MENASKALIIAGAILLSILIIAIGMYIYNSSSSSIMGASDTLSSYEIEQFNAVWEQYDGEQLGSNVKSLIGKLISNAKTYVEEDSRLPDLVYTATSSAGAVTVTSAAGEGNTGIADFTTARTAIEPKHTYFVEVSYNEETSLIDTITVHYTEP